MQTKAQPRIGISALAVHEPSWALSNSWFNGMPRKFAQHTGIESRFVASEDEVGLAWQAVRKLQGEFGCNLRDCAALVFVSPSFVPMTQAHQHLSDELARRERTRRAARQVARRLGLSNCSVTAVNWFCSGYPRALSQVTQRILPKIKLQSHQFVLVVTASKISRITDYGCPQTAGLFGDLSTATLIARTDSREYPVHFELLHAAAERRPTSAPYFNFELRKDVITPTSDGGQSSEAERLVFSLDGMGIADAAPRAMAGALEGALAATGIAKEDVRYVLPHQAGAAIVRLAAMKMEQLGIAGEVINGLTRQVGNVSSSSVPFGLKKHWSQLRGLVACPTAAVGSPGRSEVLQGCILLRATALHERNVVAVA
ncbi:3-oxoacyl-[acyl-carrier-protein] synthase III C-terminal domain-containing protein [Anatilimnocola floriformis]|uniref:3-oxoacyl-[acyl-carrier-protein] synthase III C-terminal domain-containing protein n=1 Tax=Anatilimnocola floriformis TaxID=2948575 RepID=UPI0020C4EDE1|nr:3-oxoacyl-[acyl-carrier-protein] synthase III C-terminal domain-containing protein [Anatilimnocola floriformis]